MCAVSIVQFTFIKRLAVFPLKNVYKVPATGCLPSRLSSSHCLLLKSISNNRHQDGLQEVGAGLSSQAWRHTPSPLPRPATKSPYLKSGDRLIGRGGRSRDISGWSDLSPDVLQCWSLSSVWLHLTWGRCTEADQRWTAGPIASTPLMAALITGSLQCTQRECLSSIRHMTTEGWGFRFWLAADWSSAVGRVTASIVLADFQKRDTSPAMRRNVE